MVKDSPVLSSILILSRTHYTIAGQQTCPHYTRLPLTAYGLQITDYGLPITDYLPMSHPCQQRGTKGIVNQADQQYSKLVAPYFPVAAFYPPLFV